jgi:hypothetical protein
MNDDIEMNQVSFADIDEKKRLKIIKKLNVKGYLEELDKIASETSFIPNEDQALMILHKARYFLARQGHLDKKLMKDSRRWLLHNGFKLPNV